MSKFANVVAYFGTSYFDQTVVTWYALLAVICATVAASGAKQRVSMRGTKQAASAQSCSRKTRVRFSITLGVSTNPESSLYNSQ